MDAVLDDGNVGCRYSAVFIGNHRNPAVVNRNSFGNREYRIQKGSPEKRHAAGHVVDAGDLMLDRNVFLDFGEFTPRIGNLVSVSVDNFGIAKDERGLGRIDFLL